MQHRDSIGLFGGWSGIHVGDDAILLETLKIIQQEHPHVNIQLFCSTPEITKRLINDQYNIQITPALRCFTGKVTQNLLSATSAIERIKYRIQWLSVAASLVNQCSKNPPTWNQADQELADFIKSLHRCRIMIFSGGGYLNSHLRLSWLYPSLLLITLCHRLNIPTYLCGQTIGPLESFKDKFLVKKAFQNLALIGTREDQSIALLKELEFPQEKLIRERDAAWQSSSQNISESNLAERASKIGISLQPRGEIQKRFDQQLLTALLKQYPQFQIVLFPHAPEDVPYQKELLEQLDSTDVGADPSRIEIFPFELEPSKHRENVSLCKICIGTRFHFHVFSLSTATPSISIYHQTKTLGIFRDLDLENLCLDPKTFQYSVAQVLMQVEDLLQNYSLYKSSLLKKLDNIQHITSHLVLRSALKDYQTQTKL